jgi:hypothetical protein
MVPLGIPAIDWNSVLPHSGELDQTSSGTGPTGVGEHSSGVGNRMLEKHRLSGKDVRNVQTFQPSQDSSPLQHPFPHSRLSGYSRTPALQSPLPLLPNIPDTPGLQPPASDLFQRGQARNPVPDTITLTATQNPDTPARWFLWWCSRRLWGTVEPAGLHGPQPFAVSPKDAGLVC